MRLKLYSILSILFLVIVGVYTYLSNGGSYSVTFYSYTLELPVAVWIVLPSVFLFVSSLFHMLFYGFVSFLERRSMEKDISNIKKLVFASATGQASPVELKHALLKPIFVFLKNSRITPLAYDEKTKDEDLDAILAAFKALGEKKPADLSGIKLSADSYLVKQNSLNKLALDKKYADEILKKYPVDKELTAASLAALATYGDKKKLDKFKGIMDKHTLVAFLSRFGDATNPLDIEKASINSYLKDAGLQSADFIALVRNLGKNLSPEVVLDIAYNLKSEFSDATDAWIYANLEFERYDEVKDLLESSPLDEYTPFRRYLAVKAAGLKATLDDFLC